MDFWNGRHFAKQVLNELDALHIIQSVQFVPLIR
jgi:hypothetical protein